jgi:signal transduction histidine kinase
MNEMRESLRGQIAERARADEAIHFLAEVSHRLATSLDLDTTCDWVARLAVSRVADLAIVYLLDEEQVLRGAAIAARTRAQEDTARQLLYSESPAVGGPLDGRTAFDTGNTEVRTCTHALAAPPESHPERQWNALGCRASVAVPLSVRDRRIGVLALLSSGPELAPTPRQTHLAEELARRASFAIENALLYRQARQALLAREEFLEIASHEFRTPLNSLRLQVQALQSHVEHLNEAAMRDWLRKSLPMMDRQTSGLSHLVQMLRDVSLIQAGRLAPKLETVRLDLLVTEAIGGLSEKLERAGCQLVLQLAGPLLGRWDPRQIKQIIANVMSNAVKFGAGHPIEVSVHSQRDCVVVEVQDHGPGISKEAQSVIFDLFARAVSTRHFGGLGLGLYITREIVRAHGGSIRIDSEPGAGARVVVSLPFAQG